MLPVIVRNYLVTSRSKSSGTGTDTDALVVSVKVKNCLFFQSSGKCFAHINRLVSLQLSHKHLFQPAPRSGFFFSYHVLGFRSQTHSCSFLVCNLLTRETVPYHWLGLIYRLARSKTETGKVKVVWAFPELLLVNYFDNIPKQKSQRSDGYHSTTSSHPHLKVTWARVNPDQSDVTTTAQKLVRDDVTDQRRVWGKRCQSSTQFVWMQQIRDRKLLHHWQILSHTGMGHINYAVWPTLCHFCGLAHIQMRPKTVAVWIVVWLQPWRSEEGDLWWFSTSFKRVIFRNVC